MAAATTRPAPAGVLILEDDDIARDNLCANINQLADFTVLGAAGSLKAMRQLLEQCNPDILLVDLQLPDGSGIDIIREQNDLRPNLPILVISVFGDEQRVIRAIEAGAQGYLLKEDGSADIDAALKQLLAGGSPISAIIARHLIRRFQPEIASPQLPSVLSPREIEVLNLASRGYSYQEIAGLLSVTVHTVSSYTKRIYTKLSVHSKSEAIFEAMRMGLVKRPEQD